MASKASRRERIQRPKVKDALSSCPEGIRMIVSPGVTLLCIALVHHGRASRAALCLTGSQSWLNTRKSDLDTAVMPLSPR